MNNSADVIRADLDYICDNLVIEFPQMAGKKLLITGGAGFLGNYLVQSVLHWNTRIQSTPVRLIVYDNFMRGIPAWLQALEGDPNGPVRYFV